MRDSFSQSNNFWKQILNPLSKWVQKSRKVRLRIFEWRIKILKLLNSEVESSNKLTAQNICAENLKIFIRLYFCRPRILSVSSSPPSSAIISRMSFYFSIRLFILSLPFPVSPGLLPLSFFLTSSRSISIRSIPPRDGDRENEGGGGSGRRRAYMRISPRATTREFVKVSHCWNSGSPGAI